MLDSEKYARTQELAETARDFCGKVAQLNDTVTAVMDAVDRQVRLASSPGVAEKKPRLFFLSSDRPEGAFERDVSPVSARRRVIRRRIARRASRIRTSD